MSSSKRQSSLSSFFNKKRKAPHSNASETSPASKTRASHGAKDGGGGAGAAAGGAPRLSPEQKKRIDENKRKALAKKVAKLGGPLADLPGTWADLLKDEVTKPYFVSLLAFLKKEYATKTVFPPKEEVYEALHRCDASEVKVVIIGQDP